MLKRAYETGARVHTMALAESDRLSPEFPPRPAISGGGLGLFAITVLPV
jgi:hypothetical protein